MLRHLIEAVERDSRSLRKVVLIEGANIAGRTSARSKTPAKGDDPHHVRPDFYYDQEDCSSRAWPFVILTIPRRCYRIIADADTVPLRCHMFPLARGSKVEVH
jgi:hypothetical protein